MKTLLLILTVMPVMAFCHRYYDADLGVWTSPDPSGQFYSAYSYAGNGTNPINSVDPDGSKLNESIPYSMPYSIDQGGYGAAAPSVEAFSSAIPQMAEMTMNSVNRMALTIQTEVQPYASKILLGLGGLYGLAENFLPEHDLSQIPLPENFQLGEMVGKGITLAPGLLQDLSSDGGIYNRAINFEPDASATQLGAPIAQPSIDELRLQVPDNGN